MPDVPPIPKTTKEAMIALWYTIHNGLSKAIRETRDLAADTAGRVQGIEGVLPSLWTREQHEKMHADYVAGLEAKAKEKAKAKKEDSIQEKLSKRERIMLWFTGIAVFSALVFGVLGLVL